jgi:hypothetical protein
MALKAPILVFAAISLLVLTAQSKAQQSFRICIGDASDRCPVGHDTWADCNSNVDAKARSICTFTQDKKTLLPYQVISQGSHDGGSCGYHWYKINCGVFDASFRPCIGDADDSDKCPVEHDAYYICHASTTLESVATELCSVTDENGTKVRPHQVIDQDQHEGGGCGYHWFLVNSTELYARNAWLILPH